MSSNEEPSDADESLIRGQEEPLPAVGESKCIDADDDQLERQDDDIGATGEPGASPSTSADTHELEVAGLSTSTWWGPSTVDDSMQAVKIPEFRHRPNCDCRRGRRTEPELGSGKEDSGSRMRSHAGAQTTSGSSDIYYFENLETAQKYGKRVRKAIEKESRRSRERRWGSKSARLTPGDIQECPRRSVAERMRSVEPSLAEAREVLHELLLEIMAEAQEATGVSSLDGIVIDDELPGPPLSDSTSTGGANSDVLQFEIVGDLRSAVDPILDSLEELEDESLDPRGGARHYIIGDERYALYEQIEARWAETMDQVCEDMNCRYTQYMSDCRDSLQKAEVEESVREQLRRDMAEARSLLIALLRDDFRMACEAFKDWRACICSNSCSSPTCRWPKVTASPCWRRCCATRPCNACPILTSALDDRAAELWKGLVEHYWRDVDVICDEAK
ncbi:hypothetical protein MTO96_009759 [Rhipicephalus appendiculatus]